MEMKGILFLSMDIQHKGERLRIDQPMAVDLSKYETVVSLCPFNYYFLRLAFLFFFSSVFSFSFFSCFSSLCCSHWSNISPVDVALFFPLSSHFFFRSNSSRESWMREWMTEQVKEQGEIRMNIHCFFHSTLLQSWNVNLQCLFFFLLKETQLMMRYSIVCLIINVYK